MATRKYNTTTEAEIRKLVGEGLKFPAIAERLGVNLYALRQGASLLGIKSPTGTANPRASREYLASIARGETLHEIAARFGVTSQAVRAALKRNGLPTTANAYLKAVVVGSIAPINATTR